MPLQNRVGPDGKIFATVARGTMMGNRGGCFHDADKVLTTHRWATKQWIACKLQFTGRQRPVMSPGCYTELFFLDEATALAAGHRPCFECRRGDAVDFATRWAEVALVQGSMHDAPKAALPRARAGDMDKILHRERLDETGAKRSFRASLGELPPGVIVNWRGKTQLWLNGHLLPWQPTGYGKALEVPATQMVSVLTPSTIVAVILGGYCPAVHSSACRQWPHN